MRIKLKIIDIIILLTAAAITFLSAYFAYIKPRGQTQVMIQAQEGQWFYPIEADETITVKGPIGETVIKLSGNSAQIESSPCDNKTCVAAGFITRQGQWAACLPNNVLLMLSGVKDNEENVDSVAW